MDLLVPLGCAVRALPLRDWQVACEWIFFWIFAVWWIKIQLNGMIVLPAWRRVLDNDFCRIHALPYAVFVICRKIPPDGKPQGAAWAAVSWWTSGRGIPTFSRQRTHNLYVWPLLIQVLDLGGALAAVFYLFCHFPDCHALTAAYRRSPAPALVGVALAFLILVGYAVTGSFAACEKKKKTIRKAISASSSAQRAGQSGLPGCASGGSYNAIKTAPCLQPVSGQRHAGAGGGPSESPLHILPCRGVPGCASRGQKISQRISPPCMSMVGNRYEALQQRDFR